MLHEALAGYLDRVERAILRCSDIYVEHYIEEILTPERVILRIRIRFARRCLLEINEAVVVLENRLLPLDYRYHCQDQQNRLVFRCIFAYAFHDDCGNNVASWQESMNDRNAYLICDLRCRCLRNGYNSIIRFVVENLERGADAAYPKNPSGWCH